MNAIGSRLARLLVLLTVTPRIAACGSDEGDSTDTGVVAPPVTVPAGSTAAFTATPLRVEDAAGVGLQQELGIAGDRPARVEATDLAYAGDAGQADGDDPRGEAPRVGAGGGRQLDALNAATICNMLAEIDRTLIGNGTKASSRGARAQAAALQPNVVGFSRSTVLPIEGGQRIAVPPNCGHVLLFRQPGPAHPRASFASGWQRSVADLVQ